MLSIKPYKFTTWLAIADKQRTAFSAVKPYKFKAAVWTAIKQYLYSLSNDFCGYCEAEVFVTSDGEVEHYRPKSAVDTDPTHPGYYWLAYRIDNYVPTCHKCNTGKGKRNQFPIKGMRANKPDIALDREKPLLLHPFNDDPGKHLKFIVTPVSDKAVIGWITGADEIGKTSVRVYQLNREHLVADRQKAVESLLIELSQVWRDTSKRTRLLDQIKRGNRPYASTCRAALQAWFDDQQALLDAGREQVGVAVSSRRP